VHSKDTRIPKLRSADKIPDMAKLIAAKVRGSVYPPVVDILL
jgi:hypothetical protein